MPPKVAAGKKPAPKKKNGYVMPEKIPLGELLTDLSKQSWKIGPSIGSGGFGEIYSATKAVGGAKKPENYEYVVKIVSIFQIFFYKSIWRSNVVFAVRLWIYVLKCLF